MSFESREHQSLGPEWTRPSFEEESGEFEGVAERLNISMDTLNNAFEHGTMEELSSQDWSRLQNADSRDQSWTLDEVRQWLSTREVEGKDASRDIDSLIAGFDLNNRVPAPIVLFRRDAPPYLIAGNSRLLLARAKNIIPKIFALRSEEF